MRKETPSNIFIVLKAVYELAGEATNRITFVHILSEGYTMDRHTVVVNLLRLNDRGYIKKTKKIRVNKSGTTSRINTFAVTDLGEACIKAGKMI